MQYPVPSQHPARLGRGLHGRSALARAVALALLAVGASSCALYDDTWEGSCILDCQPQPEGGCAGPLDCDANETCGDDAQCHPGNCTYWGCVEGYSCVVDASRRAECVLGDGTATTGGTGGAGTGGSDVGSGGRGGSDAGSGGSAGGPAGTGGTAAAVYCGAPHDCDEGTTCAPDGTCRDGSCADVDCIYGFVCDGGACVRQNAAGCAADADCAADDERCVNGVCTALDDLCFDGVQCPDGSSCADGKCVPACTDDSTCPEAFDCDVTRGTCSVPVLPCEVTSECGSADAVCVDGACVPRAIDEGGGDPPACGDGEVWVDNGCIPDQQATFSCTEEGVQAECSNGLLCVHRTCFVPCAPPDEDACAAIPGFETCKEVPAETGDYAVCSADDHLGGECDPSRAIACAGDLACVDGTCR